jgi:cell division cycle 20, cofactor of APC complex
VLDAPGLVDDYYLNLVSWSSQSVVAVALGRDVYLWDAKTGSTEELLSTGDEGCEVTSVAFIKQEGGGGGHHLAVGLEDATVQIWDCAAGRKVRSMDGHSTRVSSLAWNPAEGHLLSSGGRDSIIINHDVRQRAHNVATLQGHTGEVCGLSWSYDGTTLASGGNDNLLCLWDASASGVAVPKFELADHCAAIKALAWCPFERNVLASGGGTADRCIKLWDAQSGALLNSVDTGSQVSGLLWSSTDNQLLSSHGFAQYGNGVSNQLALWDCGLMQRPRQPSENFAGMIKLKEFKGHAERVLQMAASPGGTTVVSAAADETLRFWSPFPVYKG